MSTTFLTLYSQLGNRLNDVPTTDGTWTLARKKQFVNDAIAHAFTLGFYREVIDETTTVVADQVEYTLPTAITQGRNVIEITLEEAANEEYSETKRNHKWRLIDSAGGLPTAAPTVKMLLDSAFPTAGKKVRIRYKAPYPALTADTDVTDLPAELIYVYGKYLAHAEKASLPNEADRKYHLEERNQALTEMRVLGFVPPRDEQVAAVTSTW